MARNRTDYSQPTAIVDLPQQVINFYLELLNYEKQFSPREIAQYSEGYDPFGEVINNHPMFHQNLTNDLCEDLPDDDGWISEDFVIYDRDVMQAYLFRRDRPDNVVDRNNFLAYSLGNDFRFRWNHQRLPAIANGDFNEHDIATKLPHEISTRFHAMRQMWVPEGQACGVSPQIFALCKYKVYRTFNQAVEAFALEYDLNTTPEELEAARFIL